MNIFEQASRMSLTFATSKGTLYPHDLWHLPLSSNTNKLSLDEIAKELYKQLQDDKSISFVEDTTPANQLIQLRFDIVKYIIDVKKVQQAEAKLRRETAEKKQRLLELIANKEDQELANKSLDELKAMVEAM